MEREDLSATRWFTARLVVALLVGVGLFFLAQPDSLGFETLARVFGGRDRLAAAGVGFAFLVLAVLSWEKHKIRVRSAETIEALHQLLYGKDYRRDREAIEILLRSLESADSAIARTAHTHLCRLTGQNFAQDAKVWRAWWEANKARFARGQTAGEDATPK